MIVLPFVLPSILALWLFFYGISSSALAEPITYGLSIVVSAFVALANIVTTDLIRVRHSTKEIFCKVYSESVVLHAERWAVLEQVRLDKWLHVSSSAFSGRGQLCTSYEPATTVDLYIDGSSSLMLSVSDSFDTVARSPYDMCPAFSSVEPYDGGSLPLVPPTCPATQEPANALLRIFGVFSAGTIATIYSTVTHSVSTISSTSKTPDWWLRTLHAIITNFSPIQLRSFTISSFTMISILCQFVLAYGLSIWLPLPVSHQPRGNAPEAYPHVDEEASQRQEEEEDIDVESQDADMEASYIAQGQSFDFELASLHVAYEPPHSIFNDRPPTFGRRNIFDALYSPNDAPDGYECRSHTTRSPGYTFSPCGCPTPPETELGPPIKYVQGEHPVLKPEEWDNYIPPERIAAYNHEKERRRAKLSRRSPVKHTEPPSQALVPWTGWGSGYLNLPALENQMAESSPVNAPIIPPSLLSDTSVADADVDTNVIASSTRGLQVGLSNGVSDARTLQETVTDTEVSALSTRSDVNAEAAADVNPDSENEPQGELSKSVSDTPVFQKAALDTDTSPLLARSDFDAADVVSVNLGPKNGLQGEVSNGVSDALVPQEVTADTDVSPLSARSDHTSPSPSPSSSTPTTSVAAAGNSTRENTPEDAHGCPSPPAAVIHESSPQMLNGLGAAPAVLDDYSPASEDVSHTDSPGTIDPVSENDGHEGITDGIFESPAFVSTHSVQSLDELITPAELPENIHYISGDTSSMAPMVEDSLSCGPASEGPSAFFGASSTPVTSTSTSSDGDTACPNSTTAGARELTVDEAAALLLSLGADSARKIVVDPPLPSDSNRLCGKQSLQAAAMEDSANSVQVPMITVTDYSSTFTSDATESSEEARNMLVDNPEAVVEESFQNPSQLHHAHLAMWPTYGQTPSPSVDQVSYPSGASEHWTLAAESGHAVQVCGHVHQDDLSSHSQSTETSAVSPGEDQSAFDMSVYMAEHEQWDAQENPITDQAQLHPFNDPNCSSPSVAVDSALSTPHPSSFQTGYGNDIAPTESPAGLFDGMYLFPYDSQPSYSPSVGNVSDHSSNQLCLPVSDYRGHSSNQVHFSADNHYSGHLQTSTSSGLLFPDAMAPEEFVILPGPPPPTHHERYSDVPAPQDCQSGSAAQAAFDGPSAGIMAPAIAEAAPSSFAVQSEIDTTHLIEQTNELFEWNNSAKILADTSPEVRSAIDAAVEELRQILTSQTLELQVQPPIDRTEAENHAAVTLLQIHTADPSSVEEVSTEVTEDDEANARQLDAELEEYMATIPTMEQNEAEPLGSTSGKASEKARARQRKSREESRQRINRSQGRARAAGALVTRDSTQLVSAAVLDRITVVDE
ncbi:hypothetical protein OBBRIDRAFT_109991 [Obba rivulosa]|uniref:Transmembrane protein n=1 Tax=Obba rivulosa TaxID=1052685 RepID=A0A8E2AU65_9APHY|nr:hypothetical protein OBBRIDRAFT_109991 [Obba rivulosa]